jgi:hypothetical protein
VDDVDVEEGIFESLKEHWDVLLIALGSTTAGLLGFIARRTIKHADWQEAEVSRIVAELAKIKKDDALTEQRVSVLEVHCESVQSMLAELREERGEQREAHRGIAEDLKSIKQTLRDQC